jgi:hypothetical protein
MVEITEIRLKANRNLGNYETVSLEAVGTVTFNETPSQSCEKLYSWVQGELDKMMEVKKR